MTVLTSLPSFLAIGAMKAGTTSMYLDLSQHPMVFFPTIKEPGNLTRDEVLTTAGRVEYASLYRRARADQASGDASTDYAKLPDIIDVPRRALEVLGPATRILYMVREPVGRAISHHHHLVARGLAPVEFEAALVAVPGLVEYGCYGQQLEPWITAFGRDAIHVFRLEDYAAHRQSVFESVLRHLELAPMTLRSGENVGNKSDIDPAPRGRALRVRDNMAYRRLVRPLLTEGARRRVRRVVLPAPTRRPDPPRLATVQAIRPRLEAEAERLRSLLGTAEPFWDFDAVEARASAWERADR